MESGHSYFVSEQSFSKRAFQRNYCWASALGGKSCERTQMHAL